MLFPRRRLLHLVLTNQLCLHRRIDLVISNLRRTQNLRFKLSTFWTSLPTFAAVILSLPTPTILHSHWDPPCTDPTIFHRLPCQDGYNFHAFLASHQPPNPNLSIRKKDILLLMKYFKQKKGTGNNRANKHVPITSLWQILTSCHVCLLYFKKLNIIDIVEAPSLPVHDPLPPYANVFTIQNFIPTHNHTDTWTTLSNLRYNSRFSKCPPGSAKHRYWSAVASGWSQLSVVLTGGAPLYQRGWLYSGPVQGVSCTALLERSLY